MPIVVNRPEDTDLRVTYSDEDVDNPRIVRVRFANTGKQVIKGDEYLEAYKIHVSKVKLLDATIIEGTAKNLVPVLVVDSKSDDQTVEFAINTLNAGDAFTAQLVVDGENPTEIRVSGRIEGQTRSPQAYQEREPLSTRQKRRGAAFLFLGIVWAIAALYLARRHGHDPFAIMSGGFAGLSGLTFGFAAVNLRRSPQS